MAFLRDQRFLRDVTDLPALADLLRDNVVRGVYLREDRHLPREVVRVLTNQPHVIARVENELEIAKVIRTLSGEEGTQAFGALAPGMPVPPEDLHHFRRALEIAWETRLGVSVRPHVWTGPEWIVPLQGGVQLDLSKLDTVEIDGVTYTAQAYAGARWKAVAERAAAKGMRLPLYPVVPLDFRVGDAIYGDARLLSWRGDLDDHVHAVRMVNAEGTQVTHGFTRVPNHGTAYDLRYLATLIGADLGVVTALSVTLAPKPPVERNVVYAFADAPALGAALEKVVGSGREWLRVNAYDERAWGLVHPGVPGAPFLLEVGVGGRESLVTVRTKALDALAAGNAGRQEVPSHLDAPSEEYAARAAAVGKQLFVGELLSTLRHVPALFAKVREVSAARGIRGGFFASATRQGQVSLFPYFEAPAERPRILDLSRALWDLQKGFGGEVVLVSRLAHAWTTDADFRQRLKVLEVADDVLDQPNVVEPAATLEKPSMFFAPQ